MAPNEPDIASAICIELLNTPSGNEPEIFVSVKFLINAAFGPNAPEISACVYDEGKPVNPDPSPEKVVAVTVPTNPILPVACIEPVN